MELPVASIFRLPGPRVGLPERQWLSLASYREQFEAASAHLFLALSLKQGGIGLFFKQSREHQQRISGYPRERSRLVGGPAQVTVQFHVLFFGQSLLQ